MGVKRKKLPAIMEAHEAIGGEGSHELSSTEVSSNYVTREDVDGMIKNLATDLNAQLERHEEAFSTFLARIEDMIRSASRQTLLELVPTFLHQRLKTWGKSTS